ncbi:MAG: carbamoyltransferase N-terminal domain-containing protein, partial [Bryobacteraceae bacterium]
MIILGIGGILNDAACAILKDGQLVAAVEERKMARRHARGDFPEHSIAACLKMAGAAADRVDCVVLARPFAEGPETAFHLDLRARFPNSRIAIVEHHAAHAASAFFPSPFDEAAVLTLDRIGDFRCGARWYGAGTEIHLDKELYYPDSLGDVYGRVTELLGFNSNAEEHKVQWLSTAGDDRYAAVFEEILKLDQEQWPRVNRSFFDANRVSQGGFSPRFYAALDLEDGQSIPGNLRAHVAAGLQQAMERTVVRMAAGAKAVCLAGGLGMNALLVAALERHYPVFVQPAAGNAGTGVGAVLHACHAIY